MATINEPCIDDLSVRALQQGHAQLKNATAIKTLLALRHHSEPQGAKALASEIEGTVSEINVQLRAMTSDGFTRVATKRAKPGLPEFLYTLTPKGKKLYDTLTAD